MRDLGLSVRVGVVHRRFSRPTSPPPSPSKNTWKSSIKTNYYENHNFEVILIEVASARYGSFFSNFFLASQGEYDPETRVEFNISSKILKYPSNEKFVIQRCRRHHNLSSDV